MPFSAASFQLLMASLWSLFSKCLQHFDLCRILNRIQYDPILCYCAGQFISRAPVPSLPYNALSLWFSSPVIPHCMARLGRNHHFLTAPSPR